MAKQNDTTQRNKTSRDSIKCSEIKSHITPCVRMVQDGARRRYALAEALQRANFLESMFTDLFIQRHTIKQYAVQLLGQLGVGLAKRLQSRQCAALEKAVVNDSLMLAWQMQKRAKSCLDEVAYYRWASKKMAAFVTRHGFGQANALLGFVRNLDPQLIQMAKSQGLLVVGDQMIAPAAVELDQANRQQERFPSWQKKNNLTQLQSIIEWEEQSWKNLDHILSMSKYVRDGLISQGVAADKIELLRYPIDVEPFQVPDRSKRSGPLTVGYVGALNLRKGVPYFLEVAKRLASDQVRFVMVGGNQLEPQALQSHQGKAQLVGKVSRSQVIAHLNQFDLFFFPSTCEGSAGSVIEAMAMGLAVVTTPNAGSPIKHMQDGLITPSGDVDAMTEAVSKLLTSASLREDLGHAARLRVEQLNIASYSKTLASLFDCWLND